MWSSLKNYTDGAVLFARTALGLLLLVFHAWPRLHVVPALWNHHSAHQSMWTAVVWTLIAVGETAASIFLILGFWMRPACLLFIILVGQQVVNAVTGRGGIGHTESAIELLLLLIVLFFIGAGRLSLDKS